MIAIEKEQLEIVRKILKNNVPNAEIRIFGSRYKHTNKEYSDIDIAIVQKEKISLELYSKMKEEFEESNLKYRVDLVDWNTISEEFKKIIEEGYYKLELQ